MGRTIKGGAGSSGQVRSKAPAAVKFKAARPRPASTRVRLRPTRFAEGASEQDLMDVDPEIDALADEVDEDADDSGVFTAHVPDRPAKFAWTWDAVYNPLIATTPPGGWTIVCREKGCGRPIVMNGRKQELGAKCFKPGRLYRPPVCHDVSWAAIRARLYDNEANDLQGRKYVEAFVREVCWHESNLRPGHADCNLAGVKTRANTAGVNELARADALIQKVAAQFGNAPIWL